MMKNLLQSKNIGIVFLLLFISVFLGGCNFFNGFNQSGNKIPTPVQGEKVRNEGNGIYDLYDAELIKSSKDTKIVLFFSTDICGECNKLDNDILINKDQIPQTVLIMKVDYEVRKDLIDKYNVKAENTVIEINSSGEKIKDLNNIKALKDILKSI